MYIWTISIDYYRLPSEVHSVLSGVVREQNGDQLHDVNVQGL